MTRFLAFLVLLAAFQSASSSADSTDVNAVGLALVDDGWRFPWEKDADAWMDAMDEAFEHYLKYVAPRRGRTRRDTVKEEATLEQVQTEFKEYMIGQSKKYNESAVMRDILEKWAAKCSGDRWLCNASCRRQFPVATGFCKEPELGESCFGIPINYTYVKREDVDFPHYALAASRFPECWTYLGPLICAAFYRPCGKYRYRAYHTYINGGGDPIMELWERFDGRWCKNAQKHCGTFVKEGLFPDALIDCNDTMAYVEEELDSKYYKVRTIPTPGPMLEEGQSNGAISELDDGRTRWGMFAPRDTCKVAYISEAVHFERLQCVWPLVYSEHGPIGATPLFDACYMPCRSPLISSNTKRTSFNVLRLFLTLAIFAACIAAMTYLLCYSATFVKSIVVFAITQVMCSGALYMLIWALGGTPLASWAECTTDMIGTSVRRDTGTEGPYEWCGLSSFFSHTFLLATLWWTIAVFVLNEAPLIHPYAWMGIKTREEKRQAKKAMHDDLKKNKMGLLDPNIAKVENGGALTGTAEDSGEVVHLEFCRTRLIEDEMKSCEKREVDALRPVAIFAIYTPAALVAIVGLFLGARDVDGASGICHIALHSTASLIFFVVLPTLAVAVLSCFVVRKARRLEADARETRTDSSVAYALRDRNFKAGLEERRKILRANKMVEDRENLFNDDLYDQSFKEDFIGPELREELRVEIKGQHDYIDEQLRSALWKQGLMPRWTRAALVIVGITVVLMTGAHYFLLFRPASGEADDIMQFVRCIIHATNSTGDIGWLDSAKEPWISQPLGPNGERLTAERNEDDPLRRRALKERSLFPHGCTLPSTGDMRLSGIIVVFLLLPALPVLLFLLALLLGVLGYGGILHARDSVDDYERAMEEQRALNRRYAEDSAKWKCFRDDELARKEEAELEARIAKTKREMKREERRREMAERAGESDVLIFEEDDDDEGLPVAVPMRRPATADIGSEGREADDEDSRTSLLAATGSMPSIVVETAQGTRRHFASSEQINDFKAPSPVPSVARSDSRTAKRNGSRHRRMDLMTRQKERKVKYEGDRIKEQGQLKRAHSAGYLAAANANANLEMKRRARSVSDSEDDQTERAVQFANERFRTGSTGTIEDLDPETRAKLDAIKLTPRDKELAHYLYLSGFRDGEVRTKYTEQGNKVLELKHALEMTLNKMETWCDDRYRDERLMREATRFIEEVRQASFLYGDRENYVAPALPSDLHPALQERAEHLERQLTHALHLRLAEFRAPRGVQAGGGGGAPRAPQASAHGLPPEAGAGLGQPGTSRAAIGGAPDSRAAQMQRAANAGNIGMAPSSFMRAPPMAVRPGATTAVYPPMANVDLTKPPPGHFHASTSNISTNDDGSSLPPSASATFLAQLPQPSLENERVQQAANAADVAGPSRSEHPTPPPFSSPLPFALPTAVFPAPLASGSESGSPPAAASPLLLRAQPSAVFPAPVTSEPPSLTSSAVSLNRRSGVSMTSETSDESTGHLSRPPSILSPPPPPPQPEEQPSREESPPNENTPPLGAFAGFRFTPSSSSSIDAESVNALTRRVAEKNKQAFIMEERAKVAEEKRRAEERRKAEEEAREAKMREQAEALAAMAPSTSFLVQRGMNSFPPQAPFISPSQIEASRRETAAEEARIRAAREERNKDFVDAGRVEKVAQWARSQSCEEDPELPSTSNKGGLLTARERNAIQRQTDGHPLDSSASTLTWFSSDRLPGDDIAPPIVDVSVSEDEYEEQKAHRRHRRSITERSWPGGPALQGARRTNSSTGSWQEPGEDDHPDGLDMPVPAIAYSAFPRLPVEMGAVNMQRAPDVRATEPRSMPETAMSANGPMRYFTRIPHISELDTDIVHSQAAIYDEEGAFERDRSRSEEDNWRALRYMTWHAGQIDCEDEKAFNQMLTLYRGGATAYFMRLADDLFNGFVFPTPAIPADFHTPGPSPPPPTVQSGAFGRMEDALPAEPLQPGPIAPQLNMDQAAFNLLQQLMAMQQAQMPRPQPVALPPPSPPRQRRVVKRPGSPEATATQARVEARMRGVLEGGDGMRIASPNPSIDSDDSVADWLTEEEEQNMVEALRVAVNHEVLERRLTGLDMELVDHLRDALNRTGGISRDFIMAYRVEQMRDRQKVQKEAAERSPYSISNIVVSRMTRQELEVRVDAIRAMHSEQLHPITVFYLLQLANVVWLVEERDVTPGDNIYTQNEMQFIIGGEGPPVPAYQDRNSFHHHCRKAALSWASAVGKMYQDDAATRESNYRPPALPDFSLDAIGGSRAVLEAIRGDWTPLREAVERIPMTAPDVMRIDATSARALGSSLRFFRDYIDAVADRMVPLREEIRVVPPAANRPPPTATHLNATQIFASLNAEFPAPAHSANHMQAQRGLLPVPSQPSQSAGDDHVNIRFNPLIPGRMMTFRVHRDKIMFEIFEEFSKIAVKKFGGCLPRDRLNFTFVGQPITDDRATPRSLNMRGSVDVIVRDIHGPADGSANPEMFSTSTELVVVIAGTCKERTINVKMRDDDPMQKAFDKFLEMEDEREDGNPSMKGLRFILDDDAATVVQASDTPRKLRIKHEDRVFVKFVDTPELIREKASDFKEFVEKNSKADDGIIYISMQSTNKRLLHFGFKAQPSTRMLAVMEEFVFRHQLNPCFPETSRFELIFTFNDRELAEEHTAASVGMKSGQVNVIKVQHKRLLK